MRQGIAVVLVFAAAFALYGCASPSKPVPEPSVKSSQDPPAAFLGTSDLAVGTNRFAAVLVKDGKAVREPSARFSLSYLGDGQPVARGETAARLRVEPEGEFALYVAQVSFDRAGLWQLEVSTPGDGALAVRANVKFQVREKSATPQIGDPAPRSNSKTVRDAPRLEDLTSASPPDPELYSVTINEAVSSGKPTAILFATPAFCTSRTCGPQLEVVHRLKENYRGKANFIHVEIFDNPQEVAQDYTKARVSAPVVEWRLPSDPWVFLVDSQGRIAGKFESFTTYEELEPALSALIN